MPRLKVHERIVETLLRLGAEEMKSSSRHYRMFKMVNHLPQADGAHTHVYTRYYWVGVKTALRVSTQPKVTESYGAAFAALCAQAAVRFLGENAHARQAHNASVWVEFIDDQERLDKEPMR